jgi:hypothetical protein
MFHSGIASGHQDGARWLAPRAYFAISVKKRMFAEILDWKYRFNSASMIGHERRAPIKFEAEPSQSVGHRNDIASLKHELYVERGELFRRDSAALFVMKRAHR